VVDGESKKLRENKIFMKMALCEYTWWRPKNIKIILEGKVTFLPHTVD
jgi:hypothetical protein